MAVPELTPLFFELCRPEKTRPSSLYSFLSSSTNAKKSSAGQKSDRTTCYYCTGLFLRGQPPLLHQQQELNVVVELPAPPRPPPAGGNQPEGAQSPMASVPSPATYGQKDRVTYEPEPRRPEEGKGAAGTGPCTGVPSRAFPPRGQEQLPKGKARSAQPLPSKPCQPLEKPAPAYQNTPPPVLPARVRQAGGDGEQGWGAVVLPMTGEPHLRPTGLTT